jgi:hypothetical protein
MGRKSSAKHNQGGSGTSRREPEAPAKSGPSPFVLGAIVVALVGVGILAFWGGSNETPISADVTPSAESTATPQASSSAIAKAEANSKFKGHKQASLPPIPFQVGYAPPRSTEVITAAYQFAAEHPEILSYVPCFCGCERSGHQGNHDCFIKARAANGDVIAWDEHGVDCAVCIDVATRSRQMHAAGASARAIRAAIDKEFGASGSKGMATPHPTH